MKRKRKFWKLVGIVITFYLAYLVVGALAPFIISQEVSSEFEKQFQLDSFFSSDISVDRAAIIEDGKDALDVRIQMIEEAKESIVLVTYAMNNDRSSYDIVSAIHNAVSRGVEVKLLIDGLSGSYEMGFDPIYYSLGTMEQVEIRYYNMPNPLKPWTLNSRLHDKYIIIDDKLLLLGGRNTNDYFLGEYNPKNLSYDRDILVYNTVEKTSESDKSVISRVNSYFQEMWDSPYSQLYFNKIPIWKKSKTKAATIKLEEHYNYLKLERPELFSEKVDFKAKTLEVNKISFIHNPIGIMGKEPWVWYQMNELMKHAKERIFIHTPYVVMNKPMYEELKERKEQVANTKLFINSAAGGDNFMATSDYIFNKNKVLETGVQVMEFQGIQSSHGKSILIDNNLSIIGSYNYDMRSTDINSEVMLVVNGEEFNRQLEEKMQWIEKQSLEVDSNGDYINDQNIQPLELSKSKRILYSITSVVFQLFRFLS